MKNTLRFNWFLLAFLALGLVSCDNEPLEGEFPQQDEPSMLDPGELQANVDGASFSSLDGSAVVDENNFIVITATNAGGNVITLSAEDIGIGTFDIGEGNANGSANAASYTLFNDGANPYRSLVDLGGSGQMTITAYDTDNMTISGTFSFIGKRPGVDSAGNPIIGADGNQVIQTVTLDSGVFNMLPFEVIDSGGGGGNGNGNTDPLDSFSANVDGQAFIADSLSVTRVVISDIPVIRIMAKDSLGAKIRVDVPELLGVGTFDMVQISNGTELIGLYNSNTGGENLTSNPGTITITEFNTVTGFLSASFQFTGTDPIDTNNPETVDVSMGQFTANYEPDPMNPNTPLTAEIDDVFFNPGLNVTAIETIVEGNNVILITATQGEEQIEILFPSTLTEGTYGMSENVSDGDEIVGYYRPVIGETTYTSNPGELILTAIDLTTGQLEGTFTFTASDPTDVAPEVFEITLGMFRLEIQ